MPTTLGGGVNGQVVPGGQKFCAQAVVVANIKAITRKIRFTISPSFRFIWLGPIKKPGAARDPESKKTLAVAGGAGFPTSAFTGPPSQRRSANFKLFHPSNYTNDKW